MVQGPHTHREELTSECGCYAICTVAGTMCERSCIWKLVADQVPDLHRTGEETRTCTDCGKEETRAIEALGHDYKSIVTAPSCTDQGIYNAYLYALWK